MRLDHDIWQAGGQAYTLALFFAKVSMPPKSGRGRCWEWSGSLDKKGYGKFRLSRKRVIGAHRFSYLVFDGGVQDDPEVVCHRCDNPKCVNPEHLFGGTHQDNNDDSITKGRRRYIRGAHHHSAKMSLDDVNYIRTQYAAGAATQRALAKTLGVSQHCIWSVIQNITWSPDHVA